MAYATLSQETLYKCKQGDNRAFEKMVHTYEGPLHGFIYKMVQNPEDVSDLTQETFLRVYKGFHSYDVSKPFSTWIFSIAKYNTFSFLKKRKRVTPKGAISLEDTTRADELLMTKDRHVEYTYTTTLDVETALHSLRPSYTRVLELFYWKEYSYKQIALFLHLPLNTVKTHIRRAKQAFQKQWLDDAETSAPYVD